MPVASEHATAPTLADVTAADIRDYLRRVGASRRVVDAISNNRIHGKALGELDADGDIEMVLKLESHEARQMERIRRKIIWEPGIVNALSPVQRRVARDVDAFYKKYQPDRVGHGGKIVGCYADDPRLFYSKLAQKYGVFKDELEFLRPLFEEKAARDKRHAEATEALATVFRRRQIEEPPEMLLQAYADAPRVLVDYLNEMYFVPSEEVAFLMTWVDALAREEIERDILIPDHLKPPPPPDTEPPEAVVQKALLATRPFVQGLRGSSRSGDGGQLNRAETVRLLEVLRTCRDELRVQQEKAAKHDARARQLTETIHTLEEERDGYGAIIDRLNVRVADLEAVVDQQRRQIELLGLERARLQQAHARQMQAVPGSPGLRGRSVPLQL